MAYTNLAYHVVFSTKERRGLLAPDLAPRVHEYMGGIIREMGAAAICVNGTTDHVHLAVILRPTMAVSDLVRVVKTNSSKWLHEQAPSLGKWGWQESYGAFTVSQSGLGAVVKYIEAQQEHHRKMSFQEEFLELLKRHGIEYDERYIWR